MTKRFLTRKEIDWHCLCMVGDEYVRCGCQSGILTESKDTLRSSAGFSIVEVLISLSVLAIAAVGFAQLMNSTLGSVNYLDDKFSAQQMANSITALIQDSESCYRTFNGVPIPAVGAVGSNLEIRDKVGGVVYSPIPASQRNVYDHLTIRSITMTNLDIAPGDTGGRLLIRAVVNRARPGGGPPTINIPDIEVRVQVGPAGVFQNCARNSADLLLVSAGLSPVPHSVVGTSEQTVVTLNVDRLRRQARIMAQVEFGGSDVVWFNFRVYRDGVLLSGWNDGTSHSLGAAVMSQYEFIETYAGSGPATYTLTVTRLSHPSYGTNPAHLNNARIIFEQ